VKPANFMLKEAPAQVPRGWHPSVCLPVCPHIEPSILAVMAGSSVRLPACLPAHI
jgi:hypothetical protein